MSAITVSPATTSDLSGAVRRLWDGGAGTVEIELDPTSLWTLAEREALREELIAVGREALARRLGGKDAGFRCRAFAETGDLRSAEAAGPWFRRVGREVGNALTAGLARGQERAPFDGVNPKALVHVHGPLAILVSAAVTLSVMLFAGALVWDDVAPSPRKVVARTQSFARGWASPYDPTRALRQPRRHDSPWVCHPRSIVEEPRWVP
jgi:hypothetical protein